MAEIKKLRGEELQSMSWEEAKAWCEEQDREWFETAKKNGGYWCSARANLETYRSYVESRLNEHDFALARRKGEFVAMMIGSTIGVAIGVALVSVIRAILGG